MIRTPALALALARERGENARLLRFEGTCNSRCDFCATSGGGGLPRVVSELSPPEAPDQRLVLVGAEPTLSPALPGLLKRALSLGYRDLRVWTNGRRFAYAPFAAALLRRGLTGVTVVVPAFTTEAYAAATGVAEGLCQVREGLAHLCELGEGRCHVELLVPFVWERLPAAESLIAFAADTGARSVVLVEEMADEVRRRAGAPALAALQAAVRGAGLSLTRLAATGEAARAPAPALPKPEPPAGVRLPEVSHSHLRVGRRGALFPFEAVVYPTWRCNAACVFCPVLRQRSEPPDPARHVDEAAARGVLRLTLCGGEPTLYEGLEGLVARARAGGIPEIAIQTNGFALATPGRAQSLARAGLDLAIVSLHGGDDESSDRLMGVGGSRARTLAGIAALRAAGVLTVVHHIITTESLAALPALPASLHARFGRVPLGLSYAVRLPGSDMPAELVAGFGVAVPAIRAALRNAAALGLPFGFLDCLNGLVPCVLPELGGRFGCVLAPAVSRLESCQDQFVKPPLCAECRWEPRCLGLRLAYAERFGVAEIKPVLR